MYFVCASATASNKENLLLLLLLEKTFAAVCLRDRSSATHCGVAKEMVLFVDSVHFYSPPETSKFRCERQAVP